MQPNRIEQFQSMQIKSVNSSVVAMQHRNAEFFLEHNKLQVSEIHYREDGEDKCKRFNHLELLYVEGNNYHDENSNGNRNGIILHFVDGTQLKSSRRFTELDFLNNNSFPYFIRIHRTIYINICHLYAYGSKHVYLKQYQCNYDVQDGKYYLTYKGNNTALPVSSSGLENIQNAMKRL